MTELQTSLDSGIDNPVVLFHLFHVHPGNGPAIPPKRFAVAILDPPVGALRIQISWFLVEQIFTATAYGPSVPFPVAMPVSCGNTNHVIRIHKI